MRYEAETCKLVKGKDTIQFVLKEETFFLIISFYQEDYFFHQLCLHFQI